MQALICTHELENRAPSAYRPRMEKVHPFTANIRALADAAENQTELAESLGVSQGTISRWRKGIIPKIETIELVAQKLGVESTELTSGSLASPRAGPQQGGGVVMLPVSFPNAPALTRMFETLLDGVVAEPALRDEIAGMLAQRLPSALARASIAPPVPVRDAKIEDEEVVQPPAKRHQLPRRESHT